MASRPQGYGMTAELNKKRDGKYDSDLALQACSFINHYVPEAKLEDGGSEAFHEKLKDGVLLCQLINALKAGSVKKINQSKMAFKQMENIGFFLEACEAYGVNKTDSFQTVDLYEAQNMPQVINGIHALGRKAQANGNKGIGPKESNKNVREFTDEQLRSGAGVIGLQMGSNKGASQAGQNFGKSRSIID